MKPCYVYVEKWSAFNSSGFTPIQYFIGIQSDKDIAVIKEYCGFSQSRLCRSYHTSQLHPILLLLEETCVDVSLWLSCDCSPRYTLSSEYFLHRSTHNLQVYETAPIAQATKLTTLLSL